MTYTVIIQPSPDLAPVVWIGTAASPAHAVWLATRAAAQHSLTGGPTQDEFLAVDHSPLFGEPQNN